MHIYTTRIETVIVSILVAKKGGGREKNTNDFRDNLFYIVKFSKHIVKQSEEITVQYNAC